MDIRGPRARNGLPPGVLIDRAVSTGAARYLTTTRRRRRAARLSAWRLSAASRLTAAFDRGKSPFSPHGGGTLRSLSACST